MTLSIETVIETDRQTRLHSRALAINTVVVTIAHNFQSASGRTVCGNWKDENAVDARFFPEHGQTAVYDRFPGSGRLA